MRGMDKGDQLVGYYNIGRRPKKWWEKVFPYIIECALLSAYLLKQYAELTLHDPSLRGRKKQEFLDFCLDVAEQLIGLHTLRHQSGSPSQFDSMTPQ